MEKAKLTRTQEKTIQAALMPNASSYGKIAKYRGVTKETVREILSYPAVKAELERRERIRSDKADQFSFTLNKLQEQIAVAVDGLDLSDVQDPQMIGAYLKLWQDGQKLMMEARDRGLIKDAPIDPTRLRKTNRRRTALAIRVGKGLVKLCGVECKDTEQGP